MKTPIELLKELDEKNLLDDLEVEVFSGVGNQLVVLSVYIVDDKLVVDVEGQV